MARLFEPLELRGVTTRNRISVSPMCQYSSVDGLANDWHLVHLGSRAVGGAGIVFVEATAVEARGRITPDDMGLWSDRHTAALAPIARFLKEHGALAAIQLAHAGRKASTAAPWKGGKEVPVAQGGWETVAPSALRFTDGYPLPRALDTEEIPLLVKAFADAAKRSVEAGFQVIELHAAHGYLLHEFLSPLVNQRSDRYGGSLENRARFLYEVTDATRKVIPEGMPLFVRVSTTDWAPGGFDVDECVEVCRGLKQRGVDVIDASSGGAVAHQKITVQPGYQVPNGARIRREAEIRVQAVGLLTDPHQCEQILQNGEADLVALAREELRDPYFPLHAAQVLGADVAWPVQYERAKPHAHRPPSAGPRS